MKGLVSCTNLSEINPIAGKSFRSFIGTRTKKRDLTCQKLRTAHFQLIIKCFFLEMKGQYFIAAVAPPFANSDEGSEPLLSGLGNSGLFFKHWPKWNKPDCREELPILHRNSHQKAGPHLPKAQNRSFPIIIKCFFFLGNERLVFHRCCSPAIR